MAAISVAAAAMLSCSGDSHSSDQRNEVAVEPAISCSTLVVDGFELNGSQLLVEGAPAGCAEDGMTCPLSQGESFTRRCAPGEEAHAFCELLRWVLRCVDPDQGGAGSAGAHGRGHRSHAVGGEAGIGAGDASPGGDRS